MAHKLTDKELDQLSERTELDLDRLAEQLDEGETPEVRVQPGPGRTQLASAAAQPTRLRLESELGASFAGFLSYAHADDEHDEGRLTDLRRFLQGELEAQSGETFAIFQDRDDILWGQAWRTRLDEGIDTATILIPVITPRFFKSGACRKELSRFLKRERAVGREDLIFPLYYITTPAIEDKNAPTGDELALLIAKRQYRDWRAMRFEEMRSLSIRRQVKGLAEEILQAVGRLQGPPPVGAGEIIDDDPWSDDAPGLIEQLATMENAMAGLPTTLETLADVMNRMRVVTEGTTAELDRGNSSPKPGAARLNAMQRYKTRLTPIVEEHESSSEEYKELVSQLDLGIPPLMARVFEETDLDERAIGLDFVRAVNELSDSALASLESTRTYVKTLEASRGGSSTVRPLLRRLAASSNRIVDTQPTFARWKAMALEVLGDPPSPGGRARLQPDDAGGVVG